MGECPSSKANRTRSQRHGSTISSWTIRHPTNCTQRAEETVITIKCSSHLQGVSREQESQHTPVPLNLRYSGRCCCLSRLDESAKADYYSRKLYQAELPRDNRVRTTDALKEYRRRGGHRFDMTRLS